MKDQQDFEGMNKHFDSSYEDWYRTAPHICRECGALVAWDYTMKHLEWHRYAEERPQER